MSFKINYVVFVVCVTALFMVSGHLVDVSDVIGHTGTDCVYNGFFCVKGSQLYHIAFYMMYLMFFIMVFSHIFILNRLYKDDIKR